MSGIVAIWNFDGKPVEPEVIARMRRSLVHRGRDSEGDWVAGSVALGCQLSRTTPESADEQQPLVGEHGDALVFDGRIDNRADFFSNLPDGTAVHRGSADSEYVLAGYRRWGERLPENLLGDFALALFDSRRHRLLLARDALGVRPLYYCRRGDTFLVASEIKALLAHPEVDARPNDDALADFLFDHVHDLDATFFDGILSLPPSHAALISREGVRTWRYWDFDPTVRLRLDSFEEYAERFKDLLRESTHRRMRCAHPVAVSISGGLDSSSILSLAAELAEEHEVSAPIGVAYMPPDGSDADERGFLDDIEAFTGVPINRLPMVQGVLDSHERGLWHLEVPWLDGQWNTTLDFNGWLRQAGVRVMLTGNWADELLFPQAYLVDLARSLRWREVVGHLREFGAWMTDADNTYFRRRFWMDMVKFHLPAALLPLAHRVRARRGTPWFSRELRRRGYRRAWRLRRDVLTKGTAHFQSLYAEARSAHHAMCLEWNDKVSAIHGLEITYPFLDRDVVSFLLSIPGDVITRGGVPKALLRESMSGRLPDSIRLRRWKANFLGTINEGLVGDYGRIVDGLDGCRAAAGLGYLDRDALIPSLEDIRTGLRSDNDESAASLLDLLALEGWLRVFFEPGKRSSAWGADTGF